MANQVQAQRSSLLAQAAQAGTMTTTSAGREKEDTAGQSGPQLLHHGTLHGRTAQAAAAAHAAEGTAQPARQASAARLAHEQHVHPHSRRALRAPHAPYQPAADLVDTEGSAAGHFDHVNTGGTIASHARALRAPLQSLWLREVPLPPPATPTTREVLLHSVGGPAGRGATTNTLLIAACGMGLLALALSAFVMQRFAKRRSMR